MINDFVGITIVGAVLSGIIQFLKNKYGPDGFTTKIGTVGLALAVGAVYVLFSDTVYWQTVLGILASASTIYAFLMK